MPNHRILCSLHVSVFVAGFGTDEVDIYLADDFFPYAFTPLEAVSGWEDLGETDDPVGTDLLPASSPEPISDRLVERFREPTEDEYDVAREWGGILVSATGTCIVVVSVESSDEITDELVHAALPARFFIDSLDDLEVGPEANI